MMSKNAKKLYRNVRYIFLLVCTIDITLTSNLIVYRNRLRECRRHGITRVMPEINFTLSAFGSVKNTKTWTRLSSVNARATPFEGDLWIWFDSLKVHATNIYGSWIEAYYNSGHAESGDGKVSRRVMSSTTYGFREFKFWKKMFLIGNINFSTAWPLQMILICDI